MEADLSAAYDLLVGLDPACRSELRTWFQGSRSWFTWARVHRPELAEWTKADQDAVHRRWRMAPWIEAVCAVSVLGPMSAARRVNWSRVWEEEGEDWSRLLIALLEEKDRDDAAAFVEAAQTATATPVLSKVIRATVVHHHLPCPTGPAFHENWLAGTTGESLLDRLRNDPLMPDLLSHHLASGTSGPSPNLMDAIPVLLEEGLADRDTLIEVLLGQLTRQHRPTEERFLVQLLTETLALRSTEIAGGLTYLLGVLATRHSWVVSALLPYALEVVDEPDGLLELTQVIAARAERRPKQVLLKALRGDLRRLGDPAVARALQLLADSDDDTAFVEQVRRALDKMQPTASEAAPDSSSRTGVRTGTATGLWHLDPTPTGVDPAPSWFHGTPDFTQALSHDPDPDSTTTRTGKAVFLERTLAALASATPEEGVAHMQQASAATRELLEGTQRPTQWAPAYSFSCTNAARLFEDLFLGGAMRFAWPAAMEIADRACAHTPRPAGLANLLRMLAQYAPETPDGQQVPVHVAELAAAKNASKARAEARHLVAGLTGQTPADLGVTHAPDPLVTHEPLPSRGLWRPDRLRDGAWIVLPHQLPVGGTSTLVSNNDAGQVDLDSLNQAREARAVLHSDLLSVSEPLAIVAPALFLDAVVRAVNTHGPDATRAAIGTDDRTRGGDAVLGGIDLWVDGALDRAFYGDAGHDAVQWRPEWLRRTQELRDDRADSSHGANGTGGCGTRSTTTFSCSRHPSTGLRPGSSSSTPARRCGGSNTRPGARSRCSARAAHLGRRHSRPRRAARPAGEGAGSGRSARRGARAVPVAGGRPPASRRHLRACAAHRPRADESRRFPVPVRCLGRRSTVGRRRRSAAPPGHQGRGRAPVGVRRNAPRGLDDLRRRTGLGPQQPEQRPDVRPPRSPRSLGCSPDGPTWSSATSCSTVPREAS